MLETMSVTEWLKYILEKIKTITPPPWLGGGMGNITPLTIAASGFTSASINVLNIPAGTTIQKVELDLKLSAYYEGVGASVGAWYQDGNILRIPVLFHNVTGTVRNLGASYTVNYR